MNLLDMAVGAAWNVLRAQARQHATMPNSLRLLTCDMRHTPAQKHTNGHSATIYPFGACVGSYKAPHEVSCSLHCPRCHAKP